MQVSVQADANRQTFDLVDAEGACAHQLLINLRVFQTPFVSFALLFPPALQAWLSGIEVTWSWSLKQ